MEVNGAGIDLSFTSKLLNGKQEHMTVDIFGDYVDTQGFLHVGADDHDHHIRSIGAMPKYVNSLSSWEMDSITALCDTILPSVDVSDNVTADDSVVKFYATSASIAGTPERVGITYP